MATYSGDEPEILRHNFHSSPLAAFTVAEVRARLDARGLTNLQVKAVSDRHLTVLGRYFPTSDAVNTPPPEGN